MASVRPGLITLGLVGIVVLVGAWMISSGGAQEIGRRVPDEGGQHIEVGTPATYRHDPPTSGPHWPRVAAWGMQDQEVPPEIWVHNLEHGGIVILYRCEIPCPTLIRQLSEAFQTFPKSKYGYVKLLITPYSKLQGRLAILAWTWIDEMPAFDRERLLRFYQARVDKGPEDVP